MATHHNISGEFVQQLLPAGGNVSVGSISLVNIHASTTCTVDLYVEKALTGRFYVAKAISLPVGVTLKLDGNIVGFDNRASQFGLWIKLTKGASETPVVDVIIS